MLRFLPGVGTLVCLLAGCGPSVTPVDEISVVSSGVEVTDATVLPAVMSDWPWWRGPSRNGVAQGSVAQGGVAQGGVAQEVVAVDPAIPIQWDSETNVIWQAEVPGRGHGSPIVCGDQVFLGTAEEASQRQSVVAYQRATGDLLWQTVVSEGGFPAASQMHPKGTHANGTLACDGERVFGAFLANDIITAFALDLEGEIVWRQTVCEFNSKFGYAPSPVIYKSTVIFAADNRGGGCLTALDRESGEIAWRKARPAIATYSSPIVANVAGRDQLIISGCNQLSSYDPHTGEGIWQCRGTAEATCGTAVWNDDVVFASGGFPENETIAVMADGSGEKVWSNSMRVYEPSMVIYDDYIYAVTDNGIAYCLAAETGQEQWKKRLGGSFSASPVINNGMVYVSNDRGRTFVFRCNPAEYERVAENQLGNDAYASPAICDGRIYLRVGEHGPDGRQEMLYCIGE